MDPSDPATWFTDVHPDEPPPANLGPSRDTVPLPLPPSWSALLPPGYTPREVIPVTDTSFPTVDALIQAHILPRDLAKLRAPPLFENTPPTCPEFALARHAPTDSLYLIVSGSAIYECGEDNACTARFDTMAALSDHMDAHSPAPYACPFCPNIYAHKITLNRHQRTAHVLGGGGYVYACDVPGCTYTYFARNFVIRHKQYEHKDFGKSCLIIPKPAPKPVKPAPKPAKQQHTKRSKHSKR
jgi:hypothetical protein